VIVPQIGIRGGVLNRVFFQTFFSPFSSYEIIRLIFLTRLYNLGCSKYQPFGSAAMSPMDTMFLLLKRLVVIVTSFLGFENDPYGSLITISFRSQARGQSPHPG
jgi:hypothetical protein